MNLKILTGALLLSACSAPRSNASASRTAASTASSSATFNAPPRTMAEIEAQFAAEIAALGGVSLPAGVTVAPECCALVGRLGAPVGVPITMRLPAPDGLSLVSGATVTAGDGYQIDQPPPASFTVLRRPNVGALRPSLALRAARAQRALALAAQRLTGLSRYSTWTSRQLRLRASLLSSGTAPSEWTVYFVAMVGENTGPEDTVSVRVDIDRGAVIETRAGARNEVLP